MFAFVVAFVAVFVAVFVAAAIDPRVDRADHGDDFSPTTDEIALFV
jgi:hypothetical protein